MRIRHPLFLALASVPLALLAQTAEVIPLASEPHHRLAFHNDYVNVYDVHVAPHDSVLLHRHDLDVLGVNIGDSQVVVKVPGKADVHQDLHDGQIRLQPRGYVHATYIDGALPYGNTAVELIREQHEARNLCATVIAGASQNCPVSRLASPDVPPLREPQYESNETYVTLVHVLAYREYELTNSRRDQLVVALDELEIRSGNDATKSLSPGEFVWLEKGTNAVAKNERDKHGRLVSFVFEPLTASSASGR